MATSWKKRFEDLADAVRDERQARREGGRDNVRAAADKVTAALDPGDEPDPEETEQPA